MAQKLISIAVLCTMILACSTGPCRTKHLAGTDKMQEAQKLETVKIYKYDGTLQCGMGQRISLEDMSQDLKDIKVFSSGRKNDGLMRIQLCGSPTGEANVFEIEKSDLEKAQSLGFKPWTFE